MKIIKQKIETDKKVIDQLGLEFGCNFVTVYNALAFRTNSERAKDIRSRALDLGARTVKVYA